MLSRACFVAAAFVFALAPAERGAAATVRVFVVAGQSNAVGASADGDQLPDPLHLPQADVRFWFEEGPLAAKNNPSLRLTSNNTFIALQAQNDPSHRVFDEDIDKGFGPEIGLGRDLADSLTHEVAIVKFAFNGASLAGDWNPNDGMSLYPQMVAEVNAALNNLVTAGHTVILSGFFWMQGESDATDTDMANAYQFNLTDFIQRVRTDFGVADLPFVLGRININISQSVFNVTEANRDTVRAAQENVSAADPNTYMVDTDDLPLNPADGLHFIAAGELTLGQRFAAVITIPEISISGRIASAGGTGVFGVTLNGLPGSPVTDANGDYSASGNTPFSAVVTPTKAGLVFSPPSRTYANVLANQTNDNYVASPALSSLAVDGPPTVNEAGTASFSATATYSDGSEKLVTLTSTWSITAGPGSFTTPGQYAAPATVLADTQVTIRAQYSEAGITRSATRSITVQNTIQILESVIVNTGSTSVEEAGTANYTATATYDDASTQIVTLASTWSVTSGPGGFQSAGTYAAPATVTAETPVTIRAEYSEGGVTRAGTLDITVLNTIRILTGLSINGPDTVDEGAAEDYTAIAIYDDATTKNVTLLATWTVVSGGGGFPQAGTYAAPVAVTADVVTRIRAEYSESSMTRSGTKDVIVANVRASLSGLSISGPGSTAEGTTAQYTAIASLDDGSTKEVTAVAAWSVTSGPGSFSAAGQYAAPADVPTDTPVEIEAEYTEGGQTRSAKWNLAVTNVPVPTTWYRDADGDGFGNPGDTVQSVPQPAGYVADNTDCDDSRRDVRPGLAEVCDDGVDNDCDGLVDTDDPQCPCPDADGDGVCDAEDNCPTLSNSNQANRDNDGLGNVCDPDSDGDGFFAPGNDPVSGQPLPGPADCNDANAGVNPDADEVCDDGIDNDCDGDVDENDSDCDQPAPPKPRPRGFCAPAMLPTMLAMFAGLVVLRLTRRRAW